MYVRRVRRVNSIVCEAEWATTTAAAHSLLVGSEASELALNHGVVLTLCAKICLPLSEWKKLDNASLRVPSF